MIRVTVPPGFEAEKEYTLRIILDTILGVSWNLECRVQDCYTLEFSDKRIEIEDHFFRKFREPEQAFSEKNIPLDIGLLESTEAGAGMLPVIFGNSRLELNGPVCRISLDIVASSFFMLSRWEERASSKRDRFDRFPASASLAFKSGFLDRPCVNEYAEMLWSLLIQMGYKGKRKQRKYRLFLTHDVDRPVLSWENNTRTNPPETDEFNTFEYLMDVSEMHGIRSCFLFKTAPKTEFDTGYDISDPFIRKTMDRIRERGHEIGFHPGFDTSNDQEEWERQYTVFKENVGYAAVSRQHYLRFCVPETWRIISGAGVPVSSSMGYAAREGFRCGICQDFPVFDFQKREELPLLERPLMIMDSTLFGYQDNSPELIMSKVSDLAGKVKEHAGMLTLLWHNSSFTEPSRKPLYEELIRQCL